MRDVSTPSALIASEVRATLGRLGINQTELARRMGVSQVWVSTRVGPAGTTPIRVEDVADMAKALNVSAERLLVGWLPRLDSNQQPSGYLHTPVNLGLTGMAA